VCIYKIDMKISVIITSYKEPDTISKAIEAILKQSQSLDLELLVVAPDEETLHAAEKYKKVITIKDTGNGKSAALNLVVPKTKGDILILTDGDVYIDSKAISEIIKPFSDPLVGAVSGNVVSTNQRNTMYGYWAHVLTKIANDIRLEKLNSSGRFFCTGYLFGIRKELFPKLPTELLSEDGYISHKIYEKKRIIKYAPKAKVYVKYPDNFKDWIIQKKRSAGGYNQIKKLTNLQVRSFSSESAGAFKILKYISTIREFFWMTCLFIARLYLWFVIYRDINLKKKSQKEIWKRVESTK